MGDFCICKDSKRGSCLIASESPVARKGQCSLLTLKKILILTFTARHLCFMYVIVFNSSNC